MDANGRGRRRVDGHNYGLNKVVRSECEQSWLHAVFSLAASPVGEPVW